METATTYGHVSGLALFDPSSAPDGAASLEDVKEIKGALGVTVKDVVSGICAGALRRYFVERNELPKEPLLAMVPVSVRSEEQKGTFGNQVSAMSASLHTNVEEPVEPLRRIHDSMSIAKDKHRALPATLLQDFAQFAPPAVAARAGRVIARATVAEWMDVPPDIWDPMNYLHDSLYELEAAAKEAGG